MRAKGESSILAQSVIENIKWLFQKTEYRFHVIRRTPISTSIILNIRKDLPISTIFYVEIKRTILYAHFFSYLKYGNPEYTRSIK